MSKSPLLQLSLSLALLSSCVAVLAASAPTTLAVSATVSQGCSISTVSALAFGAYDPIGVNATAALNTTGQVSVACAKGASGVSIALNDGTHAVAAQRQMQGTTAADVLQYNLFQPPSNVPGVACTFPATLPWNSTAPAGVLALGSAPSKAARLYNVCGTIPAGQDSTTGAYSDTVIATLNF